MTKFLFVRHGTTTWVDTQLLHGITDVPLNEKGRQQAKATAKALADIKANKIYSSPLSRSAETAQIIGKTTGLTPILKKSLVEINFGWLEGKKIRDHDRQDYGKIIEFFDHHLFNVVRTVSGEPQSRFRARVTAGWNEILSENPTGTVIIVAHSGVINTILLHLFGKTYLNGNAYHHLNPCSITEINVDTGKGAEMVRLNDLDHLPEDLRWQA